MNASVLHLQQIGIGQRETVKQRLAAIGCAPFTKFSVWRYQQRTIRKTGFYSFLGTLAFTAFGSLILGVAAISLWVKIPLVLFGGFCLYLLGTALTNKFRPRWITQTTEGYNYLNSATVVADGEHLGTNWLPDRAVMKFRAIKREFPEVLGQIEYFDVDPFLVVRIGKEKHYVDVWGEPGFPVVIK